MTVLPDWSLLLFKIGVKLTHLSLLKISSGVEAVRGASIFSVSRLTIVYLKKVTLAAIVRFQTPASNLISTVILLS